MKIIISAFILFSGAFSFGADCVSKSEMQTIASHFSQFKGLAKADYCYDGSQTANLVQAIMFMRKTAFSNDMKKSQDELFSGKFASSWYDYFIGRISDISVQSNCPKGVGAYVYGFGSTMYVCPMMLTETFSAMDRASVFMHEARHIDGFPHTTCSRGARKGLQGACDTRISSGGSYAVTVETYAQMAKYATDLHPALKAYAMASAVTYADEAFETPVKVDREEKLLVMTNDKNLYSFNPLNAQLQALGQTPELGKIVMRAQNRILFPTDRNKNARYLFVNNEGEIVQSAGEAVIEYNSQTPAQKADLSDLHLGAQWSAKVYKNRIKFACDPKSSSTSEVRIPSGDAENILYLKGYSRVDKSQFLRTSSGQVFEFGCPEGSATPFIKNSTLSVPNDIVRSYKVQNQTFALTEQGSLVSLNGAQSSPVQTGLDGTIYEIAPLQSFRFLDNP